MLRASASISATVCSAAATMFDCGALATMIPRLVAASTSTLSTPMHVYAGVGDLLLDEDPVLLLEH
jgi:hypothetical protein